MEYLVIGHDGQEYGPANVDTLKQWVADNRVGADTNLKEFQTGRVVQARTVPFLFAPTAPPSIMAPPQAATPQNPYQNPPAQYPRPGVQPQGYANPLRSNTGGADVAWAIFRSVLAIVFFFVFRTIAIIFAIYGLVYAVRGYQAGHKLGLVAVVISVVTIVAIGIGWLVFRTGGGILGPIRRRLLDAATA